MSVSHGGCGPLTKLIAGSRTAWAPGLMLGGSPQLSLVYSVLIMAEAGAEDSCSLVSAYRGNAEAVDSRFSLASEARALEPNGSMSGHQLSSPNLSGGHIRKSLSDRASVPTSD